MHDVAFRIAAPADVDAVVIRVQSAYRGEASRRGWTTEADLLDGQRIDAESVAALIARPRSAVILAQAQEDLAACIHVDVDGDTGHFGMFAVDPERQAAGLGRRLLQRAEAHARDVWGASEMCLDVIASRVELIAWYERRGYRRTGATSPFPYGDTRFGLPRRGDLHFIAMAKALAPAE